MRKGKRPKAAARSSGGMKRNRSFLSMDNLDINEENEDAESSGEASNGASGSESLDSPEMARQAEKGYDSDDGTRNSRKQLTTMKLGNKTERTADHRQE